MSFVLFFLVVDCGDPGTPNNGYRQGNYFKFNSTINFSCKEKHHLEGARHVTCQANGKWTAPAPECLGRLSGRIILLIVFWPNNVFWNKS